MEQPQYTLQLVSENYLLADLLPLKNSEKASIYYDNVIRELDSIFDQVHGGRAARYCTR